MKLKYIEKATELFSNYAKNRGIPLVSLYQLAIVLALTDLVDKTEAVRRELESARLRQGGKYFELEKEYYLDFTKA